MNTSNGATKEISRRHENSECQDERKRLDEFTQNRPLNGINKVRTTEIDRSRESTLGTNQPRDVSNGKILERLELIETTFLSYVHGHQERLETRLEESKKAEAVFTSEIQALKEEIYNLASQNQVSEEEEE